MSVHVDVRYFAGAAAAAGVTAERLTLAAPATLATLRAELTGARPGLAPVLAVASVLLDGEAAREPGTAVRDGASVDVLPPFAGG